MSKDGLPDAITKREVIYGNRPWPLSLEECGNRYQKMGQLMDALLFFHKAGALDKIENLAQLAIEEGNAFLLLQIENLLDKSRAKDDWVKLAKNARAKGKDSYAAKAESIIKEKE
ncbi:MAG: hypothetical protein D6785_04630 [Planctomycetota bacterium]|nr:MAG: hypothetical protein D6785_04630 [Planctomycetota bacterium]